MKKFISIILIVVVLTLFAVLFVGCNKPKTDLDFSNFTMNCLGDSITYGTRPKKGGRMRHPYPDQLERYLGLKKVRNYGVSGATLAVNSADRVIMSQSYEDMDNDAQIVSVMGGCNDFNRALPLGNIADTENSTVYGALDVLARGLLEKYPNAFIFFMTPFKIGDKHPTVNDSGYTLENLSDAVKDVCEKYDIPVLDMYAEGNFEVEMNKDTSDGTHPSQKFFEKYTVPQIAHFLEDHYDEIVAKASKV